jgi:hypothetical protein
MHLKYLRLFRLALLLSGICRLFFNFGSLNFVPELFVLLLVVDDFLDGVWLQWLVYHLKGDFQDISGKETVS